MRILMVNLAYPPDVIGGAETTLATLAHLLVDRGCQVSVLALSSRGADWEYDDRGVRVRFVAAHPMGNQMMNPQRRLPQKIAWQLLAEYRGWSRGKLAAAVAEDRPDVINSHNLLGLSLSAWQVARAGGIPLVHTLHGPSLLCPKGTMFRAGAPCAGQCGGCRLITSRHRRASVLPDAIVANSEFTLRSHTEAGYFPRARRHVVPNAPAPVGADYFARARATARRPGQPLRIGYFGRLLPAKGVGVMAAALRALPAAGWVGKFAGTGTPEYLAELRGQLGPRADAVEFMGWVTPDRYFAEVDVLVIPSLAAEPQGMGVLEANARHVPVIYADRGGLQELGATMGGTLAFRAGMAEDLARVLAELLRRPEQVAALARAAAVPSPLCSQDRYADAYRAIYAGLLDPAPVRRALAVAAR